MTPNWPVMPLDFWRENIGYQPWHFWGIAHPTYAPVTSKCNDVIYEYGWQGTDEAGRADVRQAIQTAERLIFDNLHYWPAPVYSETFQPWPRYQNQRLQRMGRSDARGNWIPIRLDEGWVHNTGVESYALIHAGNAVAYTDEDGDGLAETFTVIQITSVTDPKEIGIYFSLADRLNTDSELSSRWRIEPVHVSLSGGVATIKGKRWLAVKPTIYENKANYPIDPTVATNFITTCDVYHHYCFTEGDDSSKDSQSALIWETKPCSWCCDNVQNSSDPASEGWVAGRCGIRDIQTGLVVPAEAVYNTTTHEWVHPNGCFAACSEPDRVLIRYVAGYPLDSHGWPDRMMRTLVSRLSAAEMTRRICACDQANREWSNWQFDVSRVNSPETYQMNLDVLSNPLGTRRGHIYAWQQFKSLARVVGNLV